jgi:hypothetical protein
MQHSRSNNFIDELIGDANIPDDNKKRVLKLSLEEKFAEIRNRLTFGYGILISLLFIASYGILIIYLYFIYQAELALIHDGLLKAENRSLNSTAVSALIMGTVTQTGIAFLAVTRHVFKG